MSTTTRTRLIFTCEVSFVLMVVAAITIVIIKLLNPPTTPVVVTTTHKAASGVIDENEKKGTDDKILGTRFTLNAFLAWYIPYLLLTCFIIFNISSSWVIFLNFLAQIYFVVVLINDIVYAVGDSHEKVAHPFYMTLFIFMTNIVFAFLFLTVVFLYAVFHTKNKNNNEIENDKSLLTIEGNNIKEKYKKWADKTVKEMIIQKPGSTVEQLIDLIRYLEIPRTHNEYLEIPRTHNVKDTKKYIESVLKINKKSSPIK